MFLQYLDSAAQQADERASEVTAAPWPVSWTAPTTLINVLVAVDGDAGPASEDAATWAAYDAYLTRSPSPSHSSLRPLLAHTPCGRAHHGGGTAATPLLKLQWTLATSTPTGARYDAVLAQLDRCTCVCKSSVCSGPRVTTAPLTFHLLPSALPPLHSPMRCRAGLRLVQRRAHLALGARRRARSSRQHLCGPCRLCCHRGPVRGRPGCRVRGLSLLMHGEGRWSRQAGGAAADA